MTLQRNCENSIEFEVGDWTTRKWVGHCWRVKRTNLALHLVQKSMLGIWTKQKQCRLLIGHVQVDMDLTGKQRVIVKWKSHH